MKKQDRHNVGFRRDKTMKIVVKKSRSFAKENYGHPFSWVSLFLGRLPPGRAFLRFTDSTKFTLVNLINKFFYQHVN